MSLESEDSGPVDIVSWILSGKYDPRTPVSSLYCCTYVPLINSKILIDAAYPQRTISRQEAHNLVARLTGAFERRSTVCVHLANDVCKILHDAQS